MQDAVPVEVVDRRAQVQPEVGEVRGGKAAFAGVDQARERLAGEGLQDQNGVGLPYGLVGAHDVRVR